MASKAVQPSVLKLWLDTRTHTTYRPPIEHFFSWHRREIIEFLKPLTEHHKILTKALNHVG